MQSSDADEAQRKYRKLSYWHDSLPEPLVPRSSLDNDIEVDIAIVGAGYTGLWTAYYLKKLKPELSIAIIESEIAGFGASGRNGGWCSSYLSGMEKLLVQPDLADAAKRLQRQLFDTVKEVGRISKLESIDCHFDQSGQVEAAILPAQLQRVHDEVSFMRELGFGEDDFRLLTPQQLREYINIDGALGGMYMSHCAAIHPARLACGLADVVEAKGVEIFEQTPVLYLDKQGLTTAGGQVKAGATVMATEGYTKTIKGLERKLIPIHSMMIVSEPLSELQLEQTGLDKRYTFNNLDHLTTYGQLTADHRIAFGCRGSYHYGSRIRSYFDPADPEFELVWETLLKFFPTLSGSHYTHAWGGAMGVSRTMKPAVCFNKESRIGWAGGFFGNGVGACNLAGRTMADLVLERDTDRVHTPWVNPERERELDKKLWEIEPVRWLGINSRARLMQLADQAERSNSVAAPLINKTLETFFP
jgi:glycine/D-amino acid oxidase-like deaminating enzyme